MTTWYAVAALILLLALAQMLHWALSSTFDMHVADLAKGEFDELSGILRDFPADVSEIAEELTRSSSTDTGMKLWARVIDERGRVVVETAGMSDRGPARELFTEPSERVESWGRGWERRLASGAHVRTFSAWAPVGRSGAERRIVQIAVESTGMELMLDRYRHRLWAVLATAFGLLSLLGFVVARAGLRPVVRIAADVDLVRSTTLHHRIDQSGLPAELWSLAGTFNEVLDRLDDAFLRLAQFSGDIAHELRTPLNRMRLQVEVALQRPRSHDQYHEVLSSCVEEIAKLSQLIERLLFLARAEGPEQGMRGEEVDIASEVGVLADFYEVPAGEAGIALNNRVHVRLHARVDRDLFQRAVANVVENALAYTPAGGSVTIDATRDHDAIRISVADNGCGIAAAHLPNLFDALRRVDRARSTASGGAGLGLAIVKKIMRLHGGTVEVASTEGAGTTVTLSFPTSGPDRDSRGATMGSASTRSSRRVSA